MRVDILSLLPGMFGDVFDHGIVRRARQAGLLQIETHALTDWTEGRFQRADDAPYGGGPGMVMRVEPLVEAVEAISGLGAPKPLVVLLSPRGRQLDQSVVAELAREPRLLLVAGRYEGVDERFAALSGAEELSVGDYVLSGGEIPAMIVVDAVTRLIPGAVGDSESVVQESFASGLLEHAQYTRPPVFRGREVAAGSPLGEPRGRSALPARGVGRGDQEPAARPVLDVCRTGRGGLESESRYEGETVMSVSEQEAVEAPEETALAVSVDADVEPGADAGQIGGRDHSGTGGRRPEGGPPGSPIPAMRCGCTRPSGRETGNASRSSRGS